MKHIKLFIVSIALNILGFYFMCRSGLFGENGMALYPENEPEQYISMAFFIVSLIILIVAICMRGTDFTAKLMFAGVWLMMRGVVMFIYYGSFLPNGVWQSMGSGSKGIMYPYEICSAMFWSGIAFIAIGIIIPFFKWLFKKVK